jgi:RTX calcium-binding nonapeptide repeat (4 copies)
MSEPVQSTFERATSVYNDGFVLHQFIERKSWTEAGSGGQTTMMRQTAQVYGTDFVYDANGALIGGTITGFSYESRNHDIAHGQGGNPDPGGWNTDGAELLQGVSVAALQAFLTQDSTFDQFDGMLSSPLSLIQNWDLLDDMLAAVAAYVPAPTPDPVTPDPDPVTPDPDPVTPDPVNVITGDNKHNSLVGTNEDDEISGLDGRDLLKGRNGEDLLEGGDGRDRLYGGNDNDTLLGGADDDRLYGDNGDDLLVAGGGRSDRLWGGNDDDILVNGDGRTTMVGGDGADTFVFATTDDGKLRIRDFDASEDMLAISDAADPGDAWDIFAASAVQRGNSVVWQDGDLTVTLKGVDLADITAAHFTDAPLL